MEYELEYEMEQDTVLSMNTVTIRYSQVRGLIEHIKAAFPGCVVPNLKSHSYTANMHQNEALSTQRRVELQEIFSYISTHEFLKNCDILLQFVSNPESFTSESLYNKVSEGVNSALSYFSETEQSNTEEFIDTAFKEYFTTKGYFEDLKKSIEAYTEFTATMKQVEEKTTASLTKLNSSLAEVEPTEGIFAQNALIKDSLDLAEKSTISETDELGSILSSLHFLSEKTDLLLDAVQRRGTLKCRGEFAQREIETYYKHLEFEVNQFKSKFEAEFTLTVEKITEYVKISTKLSEIRK